MAASLRYLSRRCFHLDALKTNSVGELSFVNHYSKEAREEPKKLKLFDLQVNNSTGVATLTMQSKPVNLLSSEMLAELGGVVNQLERDKCRGMVLTSALPTVFSAGLNILELSGDSKEEKAAFWKTLQTSWLSLYRSSFPTVAVINGASPAGGCLLAMSCEYRVMVGSEKFKIGLNETQLGIVPPMWFYLVMKSVIGTRETELALTEGFMYSPVQAHKIGLIDEIVPDKEAGLAAAEKFLARFERISPLARKTTKELTRSEAIGWMEKNALEDTKYMVDFLSEPHVLKELRLYLQRLKK